MYAVTSRERAFTLAGILTALLLGALDQTIVATAMPKILQTLNGLNLYTWVVTAYLLASTSMIPIYGKLSDLYGRKVVVLIGVVIFLLGSVLSGQSRSMTELVVFRALQGLGSAGIFSTTFTVVADLFSPAERGKYQGLFGAVFGISSVIGPWLGGFLTDTLSWRWVFYVNMPIGLVALLFIIFQMPPLKPTLTRKVSIDWKGSAALLLGILPILLALSLGGQEYPWGSWQVLGSFGLGAVGILVFILVEKRAREPILPFDLFANRTFVLGNIGALLIAGVAFFGAIVFLPIYMVLVVGASASAAGLTVMPLTLGLVVSSFACGQIVSRLGKYKFLLLIGAVLVFAGYWTMTGLTIHTTRAMMTWRMILLGVGIGPALPIYLLAVQNSVNPHEMGAATSSSQFFRQIGSTVGVAIFGTILATTLAAQLPKYMPPEMQRSGAAAVSFNMGQLESGNFGAVGDQIRAGLQSTYATIEAALTKDDAAAPNPRSTAAPNPRSTAARASVLADPRIPAAVKDLVKEGGPAAQAALPRIRSLLDEQAARVTGEVTGALKNAFTDAITRVYFWGLFVVALGFLVTLFLPELELRKTRGAAHAEGGAQPARQGSMGGSAPATSPASPES